MLAPGHGDAVALVERLGGMRGRKNAKLGFTPLLKTLFEQFRPAMLSFLIGALLTCDSHSISIRLALLTARIQCFKRVHSLSKKREIKFRDSVDASMFAGGSAQSTQPC